MNILFVINQIGGGGAERVLINLANNLALNHKVSIMYFKETNNKYDLNSNVETIRNNDLKSNKLAFIKAISKSIKKVEPSCIISFEYHMNLKVILASIISGYKKKLIVSERNDPVKKGGSFPIKQVRDLLYKRVDFLVCQTQDAYDYFCGIKKRNKVIIENPLSPLLPQPWQGNRRNRIVNFCRLEPQKNIPLLIKAFKTFAQKHADYRLEIYGDGSLRAELEQLLEVYELKEKVILHHFSENIYEDIKDAAMYVSSSDYEGLSNSMLEAMALGIPAICTDCPCGGARMVISNGESGLLVPVNDAEAMAIAMSRVADDHQFALDISQKEILVREHYSIPKIMEKWMNIIEN